MLFITTRDVGFGVGRARRNQDEFTSLPVKAILV